MHTNQNIADNYGWVTSDETAAHNYLKPTLLEVLRGLKPNRILDLGCGNGALTNAIYEQGFEIMGCDADKQGIELANESSKARFKQVSVYDDPNSLGESKFD